MTDLGLAANGKLQAYVALIQKGEGVTSSTAAQFLELKWGLLRNNTQVISSSSTPTPPVFKRHLFFCFQLQSAKPQEALEAQSSFTMPI